MSNAAHVFISYIREDRDVVDRLCRDLELHGVSVWLDRTRIRAGSHWKAAIRDAIRAGDFFIACFSQEFNARGKSYMHRELALAIDELTEYPADRAWFIPVLLSPCDVPDRTLPGGESLRDLQFVELFADWDRGVRQLLDVIQPIPHDIQSLVADSIAALRSSEKASWKHGVRTLSRIGGSLVVPHLLRELRGAPAQIRRRIFRVLGRIGKEATGAIPALIETLDDPDAFLTATSVLVTLGQHSLDPLIRALAKTTGSSSARALIVSILGRVFSGCDTLLVSHRAAETMVPELAKALGEDSWEVRERAAIVLGKIGRLAQQATPALVRALSDECACVRGRAASALARVGGDASEAMPILTRLLDDIDDRVCARSAFALQQIDPDTLNRILDGGFLVYGKHRWIDGPIKKSSGGRLTYSRRPE